MRNKNIQRILILLFFAVLAAGTLHLHIKFIGVKTSKPGKEQDIYYSYVEGKRITDGIDPYARILEGDMRVNQKYATYFPGFYLLNALTQQIGFRDYPDWIRLWRMIFMLFHLAIAFLLFAVARPKSLLFAIFASAFFLFNRWTLNVAAIAHLDPPPLFFLLLSLVLLKKRPWAACLILSASLGLKQIAVFVVPIYIIWLWHQGEPKHAPKRAVLALALTLSIPALLSLPFILWHAEAYLRSIFFSMTREANTHFADSVDTWLELSGFAARLPMLALMAAIYGLFWRRAIGPATAALLIMSIFTDFNAVSFVQYMVWVVPLIPLAVCEWMPEPARE